MDEFDKLANDIINIMSHPMRRENLTVGTMYSTLPILKATKETTILQYLGTNVQGMWFSYMGGPLIPVDFTYCLHLRGNI